MDCEFLQEHITFVTLVTQMHKDFSHHIADSDIIFVNGETRETHPKAKGLNNTPLPFWDELCKIFRQSRACGDEACQADDAASMLQRKLDVNVDMEQDSTPFVGDESVGIDSRHMLEDMVNAGYDIHATGLQDTEDNEVNKNPLPKEKASSSLSGQKRGRAQANDAFIQAMQDEMAHIGGNIAQTTSDIARIATSFCMDDSLHVKRQYLFHELSSFTELTRHQRYNTIRKLMHNDGDAAAYFQMPDDDAKVEFILNMLD